jgi:sulfonate transport system substrate-binding protein
VEAASVSNAVAKLQFSDRTDLTNPVLGADHRATLLATGEVLKRIGIIDGDANIPDTVEGLIDTNYLPRKAG